MMSGRRESRRETGGFSLGGMLQFSAPRPWVNVLGAFYVLITFFVLVASAAALIGAE